MIVEIDGKQVYKTKEKDNTAHPVFNEIFKTGLISSDATIVFQMWDSDLGSSDDDLMSTFSGTADYYLTHSVLVSKTVSKGRRNSLNVVTDLVQPKQPESMLHCLVFKLYFYMKAIILLFHYFALITCSN